MATKFPDQNVFFASWNKSKDIKTLSDLLVSMSSSSHVSYPQGTNTIFTLRPSKEKSICHGHERSRHWHAQRWEIHIAQRSP